VRANWPMIEDRLSQAFLAHSRDGWATFFLGSDACVTPVYDPDECLRDPQMASRHAGLPAGAVPVVPRMGVPNPTAIEQPGDETQAVLAELGLDEAARAEAADPAAGKAGKSGMDWPPALS
ncbi:CoA transferase, partial [Escherichia coli]|nr:CoA transferase [Escherichia coli]